MILWNTTVDINNDILTPVNYIQCHFVILCNMYHNVGIERRQVDLIKKQINCQLEVNYQKIFQEK